MSQPPAPFDRSWSFTDFSQSNPTTPHQGQKIDQELNNARTAINATISRLGEIQADDGKVRTTALNLAVIAEEVEPLLTDAPVQAVEAAGAQQISDVNDAGNAKIADMLAILSSQNAIDALAARDDAETARDVAEASAILAHGYSDTAQGYATTALQAKNSALAHANTAEAAVATIQAANYASYHHTHAISNVTGLQSALDGKYSSTNPAGYITSSALTGYATQSWVNGRGFLTSVPAGYATETFVTTQGYIDDAPSDGSSYGRKDGAWEVVGSGGSFLPLSGGTMVGNITFDGTSGQFIGKGQFDTSRGGNYGISLVCSIGYEFNWQAGWLTTTNQGSPAPRPLYLDSLAGTTLRAWNSSTNTGTEVTHSSIVMSGDATLDSELGGWGLGVQQSDDHTKGTTVEFNGLHTYDGPNSVHVNPTGVTFPDSSTQATAAATNNSQLNTSVVDYYGSFVITAGNANTIITPSQITNFYLDDDDHNPFPTGAQIVFVNMSGSTISFYPQNSAQILSADSLYTITKNYGTAVAIKLNATQWSLSGNLS
jgi:hypothetical protein